MNTGKYTLLAILAAMCLACGRSSEQAPAPDRTPVIPMVTHFVIGLDDQPDEHLLGRPVAVRTDSSGNIFIADAMLPDIKLFDKSGSYVKSLGGRGRGPGELLKIELMELTPEGYLVFMDRGNFLYTSITTDGSHISSYPYNFSRQFYPNSIIYIDDYLIGNVMESYFDPDYPRYERDLFHVYTTNFQTRIASFGPYPELGLSNSLPLALMTGRYPGSMAICFGRNEFWYSPGLYSGRIYVYRKLTEKYQWELARVVNGRHPGTSSYSLYSTEDEFCEAFRNNVVGAVGMSGGGERHIGRLLSRDSGLFCANSNVYIHFFATWADDLIDKDNPVPLKDLFVQVFNEEGELLLHSYLITYEERENSPKFSTVNWMDSEGNFYMIEYMNEAPVVRKFSLDFSILE